jgi:hypothetical protein
MRFLATLLALLPLTLAFPADTTSSDTSSSLQARSTVNGPCTGSASHPGICISTSSCTSGGGSYISNACPGTPADIKCCTKPSCGTAGHCAFTSSCTAAGSTSLSGLCPGPSNFKCCYPKDPQGNLPGLNSCQSRHAHTIIARVKASGIAASLQKRACEVAMVTARQESDIKVLANPNVPASFNYPHDGQGSDHDSVGIFQQRQSWGSTKDLMSPVSLDL